MRPPAAPVKEELRGDRVYPYIGKLSNYVCAKKNRKLVTQPPGKLQA